jgi:hypothetical protein
MLIESLERYATEVRADERRRTVEALMKALSKRRFAFAIYRSDSVLWLAGWEAAIAELRALPSPAPKGQA